MEHNKEMALKVLNTALEAVRAALSDIATDEGGTE